MTERPGAPWLLCILGALCVGGGVTAFLVVGPPAQSATQSRTAVVERGVVQSTVSASGTLAAVGQRNVNFKTSGELATIDVHVGEHVLAGRLLAELNPDQAATALTVAQDNLRAAEDRLEEANNGEASSGAGVGASTARSAVTKAADVASAEATVESARANVTSAEETLADTKLLAPGDGTVASIAEETPGETVSAGTSGSSDNAGGSASVSGGSSGTGSGSSSASGASGTGGGSGSSSSGASGGSSSGFITLVDTSAMRVVVPLSESDIAKVKVGQRATVTVNALPTAKLSARVISIALLSSTSSGVVSYDVALKLNQSKGGLRPGMTASAQIVVAQAEDAVNVPSAAISGRGALQTVTVLRDGRRVRRAIVTGLVGDTVTQVLSGLRAGEQVAIPIATGAGLGGGSTTNPFGGRPGGLGTGSGLGGGGGVRFFGGGGVG